MKFSEFKARLKDFILIRDLTPRQLTLSIVIGFGSVFLPFPGFQTPFLIVICLVLRLNFPLVYLVNWINNPFTMGPVAVVSYMVGVWAIKIFNPAFIAVAIEDFKISQIELGLAGKIFGPLALGSVFFMLLVPVITYYPTYLAVCRIRRRGHEEKSGDSCCRTG